MSEKLQKIEKFLEEYEDLWQNIAYNGGALPCGDFTIDVIDENDYYGCNFSEENRVIMFFFTGQSNYFPAIHIGNISEDMCENIDEFPVYIFDIVGDTDNNNEPKLIGNFRHYIEKLLIDYEDEKGEVERALKDVKIFSDKLCDNIQGYKYKVVEDRLDGELSECSDSS